MTVASRFFSAMLTAAPSNEAFLSFAAAARPFWRVGAATEIASEASVLEAATSVDDTLTIMLGGIAAISLLVGGVGVMNIMLVSVAERIREIGLRKAIGARPKFIRRQFLVEASMLGLLGGVLGVAVGVGVGLGLPTWADTPVQISVTAATAAVVMAIAIGVIFGVYPATRAARMTPIDALRSE